MWIKPAKNAKKKKIRNKHQLKIGAILQKIALSFFHKAAAAKGFSINLNS